MSSSESGVVSSHSRDRGRSRTSRSPGRVPGLDRHAGPGIQTRADTGATRAGERDGHDNEPPSRNKEHTMATLHFSKTTTATPEQILAALVDFGPDRSEVFANSADDYLKVHDQGPDWADVTEGSGGVWERLRYD